MPVTLFPATPTLAPLLAAVKAQLVTKTGLADTSVKCVARNQTPRFQGDQDILIRFLRPAAEEGFVSGSGRVATVVLRPVQVILRSRSQADPSDADDLWLTDAATGLLILEDRVIDALHLFWPADAKTGVVYTTEPMRLMPWEAHQKPGPGAPDGDPHWGETSLLFEAKYLLNLDQTTAP